MMRMELSILRWLGKVSRLIITMVIWARIEWRRQVDSGIAKLEVILEARFFIISRHTA